jgi:hypothetical protein
MAALKEKIAEVLSNHLLGWDISVKESYYFGSSSGHLIALNLSSSAKQLMSCTFASQKEPTFSDWAFLIQSLPREFKYFDGDYYRFCACPPEIVKMCLAASQQILSYEK